MRKTGELDEDFWLVASSAPPCNVGSSGKGVIESPICRRKCASHCSRRSESTAAGSAALRVVEQRDVAARWGGECRRLGHPEMLIGGRHRPTSAGGALDQAG